MRGVWIMSDYASDVSEVLFGDKVDPALARAYALIEHGIMSVSDQTSCTITI